MSYINTMFTDHENSININLKNKAYFKNINKCLYGIGSHKEVIEIKELVNAELLYIN